MTGRPLEKHTKQIMIVIVQIAIQEFDFMKKNYSLITEKHKLQLTLRNLFKNLPVNLFKLSSAYNFVQIIPNLALC